jgi:hypothetical protein
MSDKATLLREADEAFTALHRAIDGLSDEDLRRVWLGTWGVREIAIHITGWHREMIPALERIRRGEAAHAAGAYDDFNGWNARFVELKQGVKSADVLAELETSHRDFMAVARQMSDAHLAPGGPARDLFDGCGPGHYREHTTQIADWRKAAGV